MSPGLKRRCSLCCTCDKTSSEYSILSCLLQEIPLVCRAWHAPVSPQLTHTGRAGERTGPAPISYTPPSSWAAKTFRKVDALILPGVVCKDPFSSSTRLQINTAHTHTHIKEVGAAVTADRNVWKLLFSPLLSLTVYIDVFPPHSLLPGGLMYTRREWSLSGSRALLLPALSCIPSPPFCPSRISSSHHQVHFYHWTIAVAHYEVYHFLEALKPCIYLDFITSSSSPSPFALRLD